MKTQSVSTSLLRCALPALIGSLFFAGCATTAVRPTQYPSKAWGWNGIDYVEFLQQFRLEDYSRLVVEPLDTTTAQLPPKEENTYEPTVNVLQKTDSTVLAELQRVLKGKCDVSNQKPDPASPEKVLLLRGKVADIQPGSRAARYWGGFGAGAAWVKIDGEIVDAKSGAALLKFEQKRVGSMGAFGGSYNGLLTDCVVEIGRDIGRLIAVFKTQ
jgi:hypothetical protein